MYFVLYKKFACASIASRGRKAASGSALRAAFGGWHRRPGCFLKRDSEALIELRGDGEKTMSLAIAISSGRNPWFLLSHGIVWARDKSRTSLRVGRRPNSPAG